MRSQVALVMALVLSIPACRDDGTSNPPVSDGPIITTDADGGGASSDLGQNVESTIFDVTSGKTAEGTTVVLKDVIVTAVDGYGEYTGDVYVQDPKGGPGSGIKLYKGQRIDGGDIKDLKPGDHVKVEGVVKYFAPKDGFNDKKHPNKTHIKEIENARITHLSAGDPPEPAIVTIKDLTDDPTAEGWEAVLVKVQDVPVTKPVDAKYGEFSVGNGLSVDDELYPYDAKMGDCLTIAGISIYFFAYKLNPRSEDDITTGTGCPTPTALTIKDLQDDTSANHPQPISLVTVTGVISAVDGTLSSGTAPKYYGFWIQDGTGPYSGIYVYHSWTDADANRPVLGDTVEVTGTYDEYKRTTPPDSESVSELTKIVFVSKGVGSVAAAEVIANPADIATGGSKAEQYEGVLVEVQNVTVGEQTKDSKGKILGFKLEGSGLFIENDLFDFNSPTPPAQGTQYTSIKGVLHYSFDNFKILPRSEADMTK